MLNHSFGTKLTAAIAILIATFSGASAEMVREAIDSLPEPASPIYVIEDDEGALFEIYRTSDLPADLPIDPAAGVENIQTGGTIAVEILGS